MKGLLLLLLSFITLLALLGIGQGRVSDTLASGLRWLIGWGAYPLTLLIGGLGFLLLFQQQRRGAVPWARVVAFEVCALCVLGLSSLLLDDPTLASPARSVGGAIGYQVAAFAGVLGTTGGAVLLALGTLLLLPVLSGVPYARVHQLLEARQRSLAHRRALLLEPSRTAIVISPRPSTASTTAGARTEYSASNGEVRDPVTQAGSAPPPAKSPLDKLRGTVTKVTEKATAAKQQNGASGLQVEMQRSYPLPSLDLLDQNGGNTLDPNVAREKAHVIEETLKAFGVPARVVQVNQGPAVTQFGVQPGFIETPRSDGTVRRRKVKVSKITSLGDDLALALAAQSIRIEAPVPGRPYVGIEVPNSDTEIVTLGSVLNSEAFRRVNSDLAFALGRDVSGLPVAADLTRMPHLLIAGATGAGKSVCVNTIIASLLFNLGPDQLKFLMIDPKMVELIPYNGIPHLIAPVVTDMERVVGALTWAMREMDRRYTLFSGAGKRNLESYNQALRADGQAPLPYIVIVIDELADLMMAAADQVERVICRLAQMARATGIHLILATQRPSVDVVTGLIKANVPARIAFAVASQIDSRVILDAAGAEALLGRGDMLFQAPDSSKLQRLQGCFVSDQELSRIVTHWLRYNPSQPNAAPDKTPWDEILTELEQEADPEDELLNEAIAIVREHQWASTSFLQRKLRIGYTRAARIIDTLEEKGIIGPPEEGSNGSRAVLVGAEDSEAEAGA